MNKGFRDLLKTEIARKVYDMIIYRSQASSVPEYGNDPGHGWPHIMKVMKNAHEIMISTNDLLINVDVIEVAVLLHDITRSVDDENHHISAANYILNYSLFDKMGMTTEFRQAVAHCIRNHRFSKTVCKKLSKEAEILQDADRIDDPLSRLFRCISHGTKVNLPLFDENIFPKMKYDGKSSTTINHMIEKIFFMDKKLNFPYSTKKMVDNFGVVYDYVVNNYIRDNVSSDEMFEKWRDHINDVIKNNQ